MRRLIDQLDACLHYLALTVMNQTGGGGSSGSRVMARFPCFHDKMVLSFCSNTNKRTKQCGKSLQSCCEREKKRGEVLQRESSVA